MSLDSNKLSFRVFEFDAKITEEILEEAKKDALPPIQTLHEDPFIGWVSPRHLLDNEIVDETCHLGKYIRMSLAKAERKIPKSLLNAYCRIEELAIMKEQNTDRLNRVTRKEIKEAVKKQMLPKMPPTLSGCDVAIDMERSRLYTDSCSDKVGANLVEKFSQMAHSVMTPLTPEVAAQRLFGIRTDDLPPTSFTPEDNGDFVVKGIGYDFLIWLFYLYESGSATFDLEKGADSVKVSLDGPVNLILEGQGAHQVLLREGAPINSVECKEALLSGKKIASIKVMFEKGSSITQATIDGESFTFHGAKLDPTDKNRSNDEQFLDHIANIQAFADTFYAIYGLFLKLRMDDSAWDSFVADFKAWLPKFNVER